MCTQCIGKAVVAGPGEGEAVWFDGGLLTIKASAQQTDGAFALFEYFGPQGKASPLHRHPDADETFMVLEGSVLVHIDGHEHMGEMGSTIVFRRDVPHAYAITSPTSRIMMMLNPGGGENFFREAGRPAESLELPPPAERNMEQFQAAAGRNGVVLMGPPPFDMSSLQVR